MKKIISFLLVAVLAVGVMLSMVSCSGGIDDGTYECEDGSTIEIDGSKMIMKAGDVTTEWKYEIDEETNTITYTFHKSSNEQIETYYENLDESYQKITASFETIDGGFKLATKEYKKK